MASVDAAGIRAERDLLNQLSRRVIGLSLAVHRELGPGLLESAYEEALAYELGEAGIEFERQRETPLLYRGVKLNCGYRLDLVIERRLIVELKSVHELLPVHTAQLLTYLKLERRSLGLLINFNTSLLKHGIRRVVCGDLFRGEMDSDFLAGESAPGSDSSPSGSIGASYDWTIDDLPN